MVVFHGEFLDPPQLEPVTRLGMPRGAQEVLEAPAAVGAVAEDPSSGGIESAQDKGEQILAHDVQAATALAAGIIAIEQDGEGRQVGNQVTDVTLHEDRGRQPRFLADLFPDGPSLQIAKEDLVHKRCENPSWLLDVVTAAWVEPNSTRRVGGRIFHRSVHRQVGQGGWRVREPASGFG